MSKGHENQGNDHQREIALILQQLLQENVWRPVRRIYMFAIMGLKVPITPRKLFSESTLRTFNS